MDAIDGLGSLIAWLTKRRIKVEFVSYGFGGVWLAHEKKITINRNTHAVKQLHLLLHECGHVLVESSNEAKHDKYTWGYSKITDLTDETQKRLNASFVHRLDVLSEEIDAWHNGRKLAKKLSLPLDDEAYNKTRMNALRSYIKWSLGKKPDKPDADDV